jgi:hypothetical protein
LLIGISIFWPLKWLIFYRNAFYQFAADWSMHYLFAILFGTIAWFLIPCIPLSAAYIIARKIWSWNIRLYLFLSITIIIITTQINRFTTTGWQIPFAHGFQSRLERKSSPQLFLNWINTELAQHAAGSSGIVWPEQMPQFIKNISHRYQPFATWCYLENKTDRQIVVMWRGAICNWAVKYSQGKFKSIDEKENGNDSIEWKAGLFINVYYGE